MAQYVYRVYVLELNPSIALKKDFRDANVTQVEEECFYVGYSAHSTECRWNQSNTPEPSIQSRASAMSNAARL